jgi:putative addiction module component (TIGR02574 family)
MPESLGYRAGAGCRIGTMNVEELEVEALKLDPKSRAKLAERLLVSLDELSEQECAQLWAAEAQRRDADMDAHPESGRPAEDVFREAWSRVK